MKRGKNVETVTHTHTHTNTKEKGITLIALIITVILLLILAGVAINFALGDNGILKVAEYATDKYQNKVEQEQNELAKIDDYIQNGRETVTISKEEYDNLLRYPDFTNKIAEITTVGGSWQATENCFMVSTISMKSTTGNTPTIYIDGIGVITYSNQSGSYGSITNTLYIKKGQVISTRSDDIRGTTYNVSFYRLK